MQNSHLNEMKKIIETHDKNNFGNIEIEVYNYIGKNDIPLAEFARFNTWCQNTDKIPSSSRLVYDSISAYFNSPNVNVAIEDFLRNGGSATLNNEELKSLRGIVSRYHNHMYPTSDEQKQSSKFQLRKKLMDNITKEHHLRELKFTGPTEIDNHIIKMVQEKRNRQKGSNECFYENINDKTKCYIQLGSAGEGDDIIFIKQDEYLHIATYGDRVDIAIGKTTLPGKEQTTSLPAEHVLNNDELQNLLNKEIPTLGRLLRHMAPMGFSNMGQEILSREDAQKNNDSFQIALHNFLNKPRE